MSINGALKVFVLGALGIALSIGLASVLGIVSERTEKRDQVSLGMGMTSPGKQIVAGPFLALDAITYVMPKTLKIDGKLKTERRYRSLYEILLYDSKLELEGEFVIPKDWILQPGVVAPKPYLIFLVQDSRGITAIPSVKWNNDVLEAKPGIQGLRVGMNDGFHSFIPKSPAAGEKITFQIQMDLKGMQSLSWIPAGQMTEVKFEADWPHPSYTGRALPANHRNTVKGFEANWKTTQYSQDISQYFLPHSEPVNITAQSIGVNLIEPVDIYRLTERSVKYGFLVIGLTFAGFLCLEVLKKLSIHPVQYAFVGLALVIFYVLLLALSEHMSFLAAYISASLASISLLSFYVRYVVHTWSRTLGFSASLLALYASIYGILQSEDYALLFGALLLFTLLALAMIVTRKVDWRLLSTAE